MFFFDLVRIKNNQLKISIEKLELSHKNQLITLNEQNQNRIHSIKETHKQESIKHQQEIDKLLVNFLFFSIIDQFLI